ncbi:MAG: peptidylprolyl isomerase, partial [Terriglobia bacterium]
KIGQGQVIKGFEEAIVGMKPGESKTADIAVDQAYGLHHQEMVRMVERNQFPSEFEPEVGKRFQFRQADGRTLVATVKEVSESHITLDANHPLAGKDLVFEIELVGIGNDGDT